MPCTCTRCFPASPAGEQTLTPRFSPLQAATRRQGLAAPRRGAWRRPRGYPAISVVGGGGLASRAAACRLPCRGFRRCVVAPVSRPPRAGTSWGGSVDAAVGYPARKCKPKLAALPVSSGVESSSRPMPRPLLRCVAEAPGAAETAVPGAWPCSRPSGAFAWPHRPWFLVALVQYPTCCLGGGVRWAVWP